MSNSGLNCCRDWEKVPANRRHCRVISVIAGDIIGINVLDFMIIGNTEDREAEVPLFSFANAGCLRNGVTK